MTDEITENAPLNVLVTGATTALGREVVRRLSAAGHHVVGTTTGYENAALVRADGGIPAYPNLMRAGEVRSILTAFKTDVIVNAAPQAANHLPQQPAHWDAPLLDEGTAALVEAAQGTDVKFIVHTSYAFAGETVNAHGDESAAALGDLIAKAQAGERHILDLKVPGCVLRMGFVYGAESPELDAVRAELMKGRSVDAGPDDSHALWVYVTDAARAVINAVLAQPAGALLTVVDDRPASPAAFMSYFAQSQGLNAPGRASAFAFWAQPKPRQVALMQLSPHASNAEAKEKLGWAPQATSYEQGIDDVLLSWRAAEAAAYAPVESPAEAATDTQADVG